MTPRTKREYLRQLVEGKNRWSRPLTDAEKALGFPGWHERGYLPHCDFPGLIQFVTFRLADSMPASRRSEWAHLLEIEDVREKRTKLEGYLDRGLGACHLRDPQTAQLAEEALLHFHDQEHELLAWCVLPNHVHVLVHVWQQPLWKLVRSWKRFVVMQSVAWVERRPPARPCEERGEPRAGSETGAPFNSGFIPAQARWAPEAGPARGWMRGGLAVRINRLGQGKAAQLDRGQIGCRTAQEPAEVGPGEVELDGGRLVADQRSEATDQIKGLFHGWPDLGAVGAAADDGHARTRPCVPGPAQNRCRSTGSRAESVQDKRGPSREGQPQAQELAARTT